jgi:hypothetical protein
MRSLMCVEVDMLCKKSPHNAGFFLIGEDYIGGLG